MKEPPSGRPHLIFWLKTRWQHCHFEPNMLCFLPFCDHTRFLLGGIGWPTSYIRVSSTVKLSFGWTLPLKAKIKIIWEHIVNRSPPATQIAPVGEFMKWKCVLGTNIQRSEATEGQISGSAVMKCIMLPPHHSSVPLRSCAQLWSRIALQRMHQRDRLIWAVLPQRMGLLSKNTPSQFGTT